MASETVAQKHVKGINHVALVCSNAETTTNFVTKLLGFPLVESFDIYNHKNEVYGKHITFDIGEKRYLTYFWFPKAPKSQPGISSAQIPNPKINPFDFLSAHGSVNHIAFEVDSYQGLKQLHESLLAKKVPKLFKRLIYHILNQDTLLQSEKEAWDEHKKLKYSKWVSFYLYGPDNEYIEFTYENRSHISKL